MFKVLGGSGRGIRLIIGVIILVALHSGNIWGLVLIFMLEVENGAIGVGINGRNQAGEEPLINFIDVVVDPVLDHFQHRIDRVVILGKGLGKAMVNLRRP